MVMGQPVYRQNNVKAILCMFLGMFFFSIADAQSKFLTASLPAMQIAWARWLVLFCCVIVYICSRGVKSLETKHPFLQVFRGVTVALSAAFFTIGLSFAPLADAVAITFIAPIIVTILSAYLLGERVGKRRWAAVIMGFFGVIMITQPSFDDFNPGLLFPFLAALFFAIRQIISRRVSHKDDVQTTVAYTALTSFFLLSMCLPVFWVEVSSELDAITLLSLSAFSAIGEIFIVYALSIGLAVVVTPIHYTIIVWALLYGYFFFDDVPNTSMMFGTIVVMLCGLYIAHREHRLSLKI